MCHDPSLTIVASSLRTTGSFVVTARLSDSCGIVAKASVNLFQGDTGTPIYLGSDKVIDSRTTGADGMVTFTVASFAADRQVLPPRRGSTNRPRLPWRHGIECDHAGRGLCGYCICTVTTLLLSASSVSPGAASIRAVKVVGWPARTRSPPRLTVRV